MRQIIRQRLAASARFGPMVAMMPHDARRGCIVSARFAFNTSIMSRQARPERRVSGYQSKRAIALWATARLASFRK
jgi:hypothetical protein